LTYGPEQTIALDALHALKKRVRAAQREKLLLREEILRIRAERDQVALRMDAVRTKHEAESKEALVSMGNPNEARSAKLPLRRIPAPYQPVVGHA